MLVLNIGGSDELDNLGFGFEGDCGVFWLVILSGSDLS